MNIKLFYQKLVSSKRDILLIAILLGTLLIHSVNLFGYPSYREDEGTYMSQSWAVQNLGRLAPYTYWYDHSPVGWILIAAWKFVAGDFLAPGLDVNSGRIFMGLIAVVSTFLVYRIAGAVTRRREAAAIAAILFAASPLAVIFHRHVLLDNIMTFWFLLSLYFAVAKPVRLKYAIMSAISFGLAVLSKESAIAFLPGMAGLVWALSHKNHKHFAFVSWVSVAVLLVSFYPVFALLKGELFPTGTLLGGDNPHVSLWQAIEFQLGRTDTFFLNPGSSFLAAVDNTWLRYGSLLIVFGIIAMVAQLCLYRRNKVLFWLGVLSLSFLFFVVRGQVLDWYIIPAMPLFSLGIAAMYGALVDTLREKPIYALRVRRTLAGVTVGMVFVSLLVNHHIFTLDLTKNQVEAVAWVRGHIHEDAVLLIDNYAFVDLNPKLTDITKTNVHYYWKADTDPQIKNDVLENKWDSVDYVLSTPGMVKSMYDDNLSLVREAYEKSHVVRRFSAYESWREGYPVEIRQVNNARGPVQLGWSWYKDNYITAEGQIMDPSNGNQTTSEGQSYALMRAVWEGDRATFDRVLSWTMRHLKDDDTYLFSWLAETGADGSVRIKDRTSASDADEDVALSLLFAYKKWNDESYRVLAKNIIEDIWRHEVIYIDGLYYVTAGTGLRRDNGYLINPSYFSPASYRIFADADPTHPWHTVAGDTYRILDRLEQSPVFAMKKTYLVPNWFIVDGSGDFHSTVSYTHAGADYYGYDAFRIFWRVALDYVWFQNSDAKEYLEKATPFFKNEWLENRRISSVYQLDGTAGVAWGDVSTDTGALSVFFVTEPELAIDMYSTNFWPKFNKGYWGDKSKYYDQNWAWFGTALYTHNLPNLWTADTLAIKQ